MLDSTTCALRRASPTKGPCCHLNQKIPFHPVPSHLIPSHPVPSHPPSPLSFLPSFLPPRYPPLPARTHALTVHDSPRDRHAARRLRRSGTGDPSVGTCLAGRRSLAGRGPAPADALPFQATGLSPRYTYPDHAKQARPASSRPGPPGDAGEGFPHAPPRVGPSALFPSLPRIADRWPAASTSRRPALDIDAQVALVRGTCSRPLLAARARRARRPLGPACEPRSSSLRHGIW